MISSLKIPNERPEYAVKTTLKNMGHKIPLIVGRDEKTFQQWCQKKKGSHLDMKNMKLHK